MKEPEMLNTPTLTTDKYLNPIRAYDALHAIDVELYMVTAYGPEVGSPYDQISAEHVYAAKMMIEALIKAQKL